MRTSCSSCPGVSKRIHGDILRAVSHLDDLEDAFIGFDSKLRRLSRSISVIDESSSYLKHHRSTNAHDRALDSLISMTTIDPHMEHVLEMPISAKHFDRIRSAFNKLQSSIGELDAESQDMNRMRAVRDARYVTKLAGRHAHALTRSLARPDFLTRALHSFVRQAEIGDHSVTFCVQGDRVL